MASLGPLFFVDVDQRFKAHFVTRRRPVGSTEMLKTLCFQEVPEETWAAWNSVFDRLDTDGDNVMSPGELRQGEAELNPSDEQNPLLF